jgi:glutamate transport system permease protein
MTALTAGSATRRSSAYRAFVVAGFVFAGAVVGLIVWRLLTGGAFSARRWRPFGQWVWWKFLLTAFLTNLRAGGVAGVLALLLGLLLGLGRLSRTPLLRWPATAWIEIFRSLPLIYLIFFAALFLPRYTGWKAPILYYGIAALVAYNSSVIAEIVRAGVLSLARGQREAAESLGLPYWKVMRLVLLPQALRRMVPALVSQLVTLLKDTSLLFVIGAFELLRAGNTLQSGEFNPLQTYFVVGMMFLVVNLALSRVARRLEVRQRRRYGAGALHVGGIEDLAAIEAEADMEVKERQPVPAAAR